MLEARSEHTATLLPDGRVVVAGGVRGPNTLSSVEVYNYTTGSWSLEPSMSAARRETHGKHFSRTGVSLVIGGRDGGGDARFHGDA